MQCEALLQIAMKPIIIVLVLAKCDHTIKLSPPRRVRHQHVLRNDLNVTITVQQILIKRGWLYLFLSFFVSVLCISVTSLLISASTRDFRVKVTNWVIITEQSKCVFLFWVIKAWFTLTVFSLLKMGSIHSNAGVHT